MEKTALGSSGLEVSVFGMGTMTFGAESDEAASHAMLDEYFQAGGRFIDTADVYSRGGSEEIVGRWISMRGNRDELVVATKAFFTMGEGLRGAGAEYLKGAVDASLSRLGVDYIDLYQIHAWDPNVPLAETIGALAGFVEDGKVRQIGFSNYTGWQIERAVWTTREVGGPTPASIQPQYNLLARDIELEILPACMDNGIGLLPWSPLGGGWLTGKYSRSERPEGASRLGEDPNRGVEAYDRRNTETTWKVLEAVEDIANARGSTMSQVALNWVRNRPAVSSVLLGARTVAQLTDNLGALSWNLTEDEMARLTEASAPGIPDYVHGFLRAAAGVTVWDELGTVSPSN